MTRIPIPIHEGIEFVLLQEILYFQSDGNYSILFHPEKTKKFTLRSLKELERQLEGRGFCRIHHEFLVNLSHIVRYYKGDGGEVELTNGERLAVSRGKKANLLSALRLDGDLI